MTRDEAIARMSAIWPDHPNSATSLPMSAMGVLKILEALELIKFKGDGVALKSIAHPEGKALAEDADINPDTLVSHELDDEQVEQLKAPAAPLKVKRAAKNEG